MAKTKMKSPNIISLVLMLVFLFLFAVIGYATFKGGLFELRSKAANETLVYKLWDFTDGTQGWAGGNLTAFSSSNNDLIATIGSKQGNISTTTNVGLPQGNKYIHIRMRVVPKSGSLTPNDRFALRSFVFSLAYWVTGEKLGQPPKSRALLVKGVADGTMRDYYLLVPSIDAITIRRIWLGFYSGVISGDQVQFDYIRLIDLPPATPTSNTGTSSRNSNTIDDVSRQNNNPQATPYLPPGTLQVPPSFYRQMPTN